MMLDTMHKQVTSLVYQNLDHFELNQGQRDRMASTDQRLSFPTVFRSPGSGLQKRGGAASARTMCGR